MASAKRVETTRSCRPKVIWVGALILGSCAAASWAMTASDCCRKAASGWSAAPHECRKGLDVVRFCRIELGREAPWKNALDDHVGHAAESLGHRLPALDGDLEVGVGFRPWAVERQRFHPLGMFGGEPHADGRPQR